MSYSKPVYMKQWREDNIEHVKEYEREYEKNPERIKNRRIRRWKRQGIIINNNDWDKFYDYFLSIDDCQQCKVKMTYDIKNTKTTKCVDHNHNIIDRENVRFICCNSCNCQDKVNNTSGEPNVSYYKRTCKWRFQKKINGKYHTKSGFETFDEAVEYKRQYMKHLIKA